jgi:hypothetical protein
MRMPDPLPTFTEVVKRIRVGYPDFAYLHVIEPTTHHRPDRKGRDSAIDAVEKEGGLVSFARHFISIVSK